MRTEWMLVVSMVAVGCGRIRYRALDSGHDAPGIDVRAEDTGADSSSDTSRDVGVDVGGDAGFDVGVDAGFDVGVDAGFDVGVDAGFDVGVDAGFDVGVDAGFDVGVDAGRDVGVDAGLCGAVFVNPAAFTDLEVWTCALAAQLGRCRIADQRACPGCACDYYANNSGWNCPAVCPTDLSPTGCLGFRGSGPFGGSFGCPATSYEAYGACVMRHEITSGHCAPCSCPPP